MARNTPVKGAWADLATPGALRVTPNARANAALISGATARDKTFRLD